MAPAQLSRAILPTSGAVEREFREMITDGWFGTWFLFFHRLGIIIPTDELICFRGIGIPPTR